MSKRHEAQQRRRTTDGFGQRGPRYDIRESRRAERYLRTNRLEFTIWYVVVDGETDQAVSEEFSEWRHARQLAERLNGGQRRDERKKQRERASLAPTRPLHQRVELILDEAGMITGGCPRHKTAPLLSISTDRDGSVVVRPNPLPPNPWTLVPLRDPARGETIEALLVGGSVGPLTKAGLFATEERDTRGPLVRVRAL